MVSAAKDQRSSSGLPDHNTAVANPTTLRLRPHKAPHAPAKVPYRPLEIRETYTERKIVRTSTKCMAKMWTEGMKLRTLLQWAMISHCAKTSESWSSACPCTRLISYLLQMSVLSQKNLYDSRVMGTKKFTRTNSYLGASHPPYP